jgi:hypothetical protein
MAGGYIARKDSAVDRVLFYEDPPMGGLVMPRFVVVAAGIAAAACGASAAPALASAGFNTPGTS